MNEENFNEHEPLRSSTKRQMQPEEFDSANYDKQEAEASWLRKQVDYLRQQLNSITSSFNISSREKSNLARLVSELRQELIQSRQENEKLTQQLAGVTREFEQTDERLGILLAHGSTLDRGALSISSTTSDPEKNKNAFAAFKNGVEEISRTLIRTQTFQNQIERRTSLALLQAKLTEYLFRFGSTKLAFANELDEIELPNDLSRLISSEVVLGSLSRLRAEVVQLVYSVVISTAPSQPGKIVFVARGTFIDPHEVDVFPGCEEGENHEVVMTVFPGYRVGDTYWVRPMVWTAPIEKQAKG